MLLFEKLSYSNLNHYNDIVDLKKLEEKSKKDIKDETIIIGQEKGIRALDFGLLIKNKGYNIFATGPIGTGKTTYAKLSTKKIAMAEKTPNDWAYVYNFNNPKTPIALSFEAGLGLEFKDDMTALVEIFNVEIKKTFNSEDYEKQRKAILKDYDLKQDELTKKMSVIAKDNNFKMKQTATGIYFLPIVAGEVVLEDAFDDLDEDVKDAVTENIKTIQDKTDFLVRDMRTLEKECDKKIEDLDYKIGLFAIGHHINSLREKYINNKKVVDYLLDVEDDVLENISFFYDNKEQEEDSFANIFSQNPKKSQDDITHKYSVNLIVDNKNMIGAPVVIANNANYQTLVGEVLYESEFGNLTTDFMNIKGGLFHEANGGYLIIQALDLMINPSAYDALKRCMKTEEIVIEPPKEQISAYVTPTQNLEPIPFDLKVIIIGNDEHYNMFYEWDDDFLKHFKIRADFDFEMERNDENITHIINFVRGYTKTYDLQPFDLSAIFEIVNFATRLSDNTKKLSTNFNVICEIICEANAWTKLENKKSVTAKYVEKAIEERQYRINFYEEKISNLLDENIIMIDTIGKKVGQINSLAVLESGNYTFGEVCRITATTYMGMSGIINIENEADMSGRTHNKGIQIISGYLGEKYAQNFPLSLSCSICFEQNYSGIDGDSASSTELYAILSSLAGVPINQQLAVTGSVNQKGEIQAIGGATAKVEAFYNLCKKRGFTGEQGVIIPKANISDLVLKKEVLKSVENEEFHIYAISTIDEGIELLTGVCAGSVLDECKFEKETIHHLVMKKLKKYHKKSKNASS